MKQDPNLKTQTPTYAVTQTGVVRIDPVMEWIQEWIEVALNHSYITLPRGLYSEAELDEYEAHLDAKYSDLDPPDEADL
jgi:hypothetical protein